MKTTIPVKQAYHWFDEEITVQIKDVDGELLECNHAGKYQDQLDYGHASYEKCDWVDDWHNSWVCDKCDWTEYIEPEEPEYERDEY